MDSCTYLNNLCVGLPTPREVLGPEDSELTYFMWMPGFEYRAPEERRASIKRQSTVESHLDQPTEEDYEQALDELVEVDRIKEEFNKKQGGSNISPDAAVEIARQMGLAPSSADVEAFRKQHGDSMDYDSFRKFLLAVTHPEDNVEELIKIFASFDRDGSGQLKVGQVLNILRTFGDTLNPTESEAFEKLMLSGKKLIDYTALVNQLLEKPNSVDPSVGL